ncbi:MAG: SRPBCC family protein [Planctomycetota bacterium]|nr:SRPBCC family protein [Planctomycetota bacterium]
MTQEDRDSAMQEGSESRAEDENPQVKGPLRFLAFIFGLLVVVALVMAVAGSFLPREFEVETSIYLDRPPQVAFQKINELKAWQEWCPWNEETMPGMVNQYSGAERGLGAEWSWEHESGDGKQWITFSQDNLEIEMATEFADYPPMTSVFAFEPESRGTRITWRTRGRVKDGPVDGWMCLMMPSMISAEYDRGLQKLVKMVEAEQPEGGEYPTVEAAEGPAPVAGDSGSAMGGVGVSAGSEVTGSDGQLGGSDVGDSDVGDGEDPALTDETEEEDSTLPVGEAGKSDGAGGEPSKD